MPTKKNAPDSDCGGQAPALRNNSRAPVPAAAAGQIKVLSDLVLLFPEDAIDMQVLADLKRVGRAL